MRFVGEPENLMDGVRDMSEKQATFCVERKGGGGAPRHVDK